MADFRRWIFALAVVALLAGLSVPASAQPVVCNTSVSVTPIVRSEGLAELVGDLVLYCTGGTPTAPGVAVPQVNITVFLNTNITSKVLGTQLVAFGNGQTSALDEALLIIDEPNSLNSPGYQCAAKGAWNGSAPGETNICLGTLGAPGALTYSTNGLPYPILNCGAVVGGAPAAPDGGPSGPGVCEIIAPGTAAGKPAPEHTYDGTVAGGSYTATTFPDACQTVISTVTFGITTVSATITNGSSTVTIPSGVSPYWSIENAAISTNPAGVGPSTTTGIPSGSSVTSTLTSTSISISNNAVVVGGGTATVNVTISGLLLTSPIQGSNLLAVPFPNGWGTGSGPTRPLSAFIGGTVIDAAAFLPPGTTITGISGNDTLVLSNAPISNTTSDPITITYVSTIGTIGTTGSVGGPGYSCGRPNVFQGRLGALQNPNQYNAVTFWGVPLDPPGTAIGRTLRFTNIRANANQLGVSSTFTTQQILMNIAINGPTTVTLANPQQIVAYVNKGLNPAVQIAPNTNATYFSGGNQSGQVNNNLPGGSQRSGLAPNVPIIGEFVQCISQNPDLFSGTPAPSFLTPGYLGNSGQNDAQAHLPGGYNCPAGGDCQVPAPDVTPWIRFSEGFASSWKEKNISFTVGDGTGSPTGRGNANCQTSPGVFLAYPCTPNSGLVVNGFACPNAYCYDGLRNYPLDVPQNVPGAVYNTETGFSYPATFPNLVGPPPLPNPPFGFGTASTPPAPNPNPNPFTDDWGGTANATGIGSAGQANQGTRLYLSFGNIPAGSSLWLPPVLYLFRQGVTHNGDPATLGPNPLNGVAQSQATGVMVMTNTDTAGAGPFARSQAINPFTLTKVGATGLVVYEILYADPFSTEYVDVPVVLAYASNPGQNLPAPAPPNPNTSVTGGFAPFYTSAASTQPSPNSTFQSPTLPVPRFVPGQAFDFINIQKCACNLLFPFVANVLGYDTGIAIANASLDPGATFGFLGVPQPGTIEFWYYGDMANGAAVPGPQTSSVVQPGHVLTYVLSSGSSQYGLDGRGAGLQGYIITQAQFQYCHAYAFVSAQGAGPTSPGVSEGYLGIVLDRDGLPRTISLGENKAH